MEREIEKLEDKLSAIRGHESGEALLDDLKEQLEKLRDTKESVMQSILDEDTDYEA